MYLGLRSIGPAGEVQAPVRLRKAFGLVLLICFFGVVLGFLFWVLERT